MDVRTIRAKMTNRCFLKGADYQKVEDSDQGASAFVGEVADIGTYGTVTAGIGKSFGLF